MQHRIRNTGEGWYQIECRTWGWPFWERRHMRSSSTSLYRSPEKALEALDEQLKHEAKLKEDRKEIYLVGKR